MVGSLGAAFFSLGNTGPTEVAALAAELELTAIDHIFMTESNNDAMTSLMSIAMATSTVQIGSAIANIYLRHPLQMAQAAASVEEASAGRLILGLGVGHQLVNELGLGLDMSRPIRDMREYVEVIRRGFEAKGGTLDYVGDRFSVEGPRATVAWPPQRHVPIIIAAHGPQMIRVAAAVADGILTSVVSTAQIGRLRGLLSEHCERIGRDPAALRIYSMVYTCLDDDRTLALRKLRERIELSMKQIYYATQVEREGLLDDQRALSDEAVAQLGIAGPVEHAKARLDEYRAAGVDVPMLAPFTRDPDDVVTGYRTFTPEAYLELAELG